MRRCLDDDVRIGAAHTERADRRAARLGAGGPRRQARRDRQPGALQCDVRVQALEQRLRRYRLVPQGEHHLEQPRDAGGGLEMADVGLGRAEQARSGAVESLPHRRGDGLHFDRIAQRRAGAVRLHESEARGLDLRRGQRLADQGLLRRPARRGEQGGVTVLIHCRAAHHRQNTVAVGHRIGEPLEDDHAAPLAAAESVGRRVKGLAASVGGHEADLGHRHQQLGPDDQ